MKTTAYLTLLLAFIVFVPGSAQTAKPDPNSKNWTVFNRAVNYDGDVIHLDAKDNDGVLWLNGSDFGNGTIELDIKGKDVRGESFVGIAFHGKDDRRFDGIYFRPFNFKDAERNSHSVQYISLPDNDWSILRKNFPGKYENKVNPVPDPNGWFHATILVTYPVVQVYVNGNKSESLKIEQLSQRKQGKFGLWVGNGSEGWFKNITVKGVK